MATLKLILVVDDEAEVGLGNPSLKVRWILMCVDFEAYPYRLIGARKVLVQLANRIADVLVSLGIGVKEVAEQLGQRRLSPWSLASEAS